MTALHSLRRADADDRFPPAVIALGAVAEAPLSFFRRKRPNTEALVEALAERYPVVRKLLCEESFREIARCYAAIEPSVPGSFAHYGQSFPDFVRNLGGGATFDYLADVAELENARARAQQAPTVEPLTIEAFSGLSASKFSLYRVTLHPSVNLVMSRFPVVSIWEANQPGRGNDVPQWNGQSALVAQLRETVETWILPAGGVRFFSALLAGASLQQAIDRAGPDFDLAGNLTLLVASGLVVGLHWIEADARVT
jgi:hypothetical protein